MSDYRKNVDHKTDSNPLWSVLENRYDKYFFNFSGDRTPIIPKKIHQVWVGSPLPDKYNRLAQTWRDKHPDWEYRLWTDADVESFGLRNKPLFDALGNKGAKADIFRYEIVYRHGGLYIDTDFECVKPMDDLMYLDFFAGSGWTETPVAFNGLFASLPQHPLLKEVIDNVNAVTIQPHDRHQEVMQTTGACFFSDIVTAYMNNHDERVVVFPKNFFYPCSTEIRFELREDTEKARKLSYSFITDRTYCIHLWYTSWIPPKWQGIT